ncbi:MAG: MFS transporter [Rhizobiaceae bacterium]|nr:MFS transporter [Rhizobiaceae bacterium]
MTGSASIKTSSAAASRAGLTALALAILLASLGVSISTTALPVLAVEFSAPMYRVQWVVLTYLLSLTATVVIGGRLGDLFGKRTIFLAGLALFVAASGLSALAPSLGALIAARALQGVGGAILMALPMAIARETVSPQLMGTAMGVLGTMSAIGTALGPSLAGILIDWSGWRLAFVVLALAGLSALAFAAVAVPADRKSEPVSLAHVDMPGAVVLALTLVAFALAMTGGERGFAAAHLVLLVLALSGCVVFVLVERTRPAPLVQLAALREAALATGLAANLIVATVMMSTLVVGPFFLTLGLGLDAIQAGLVLSVGPAASALSGIPAGRITDRLGTARVVRIGLLQIFAGLACLAVVPQIYGVAGYVLSLLLLTPGFQLFLAANNTELMLIARQDQRGMVSGLLGLSRNLGFMTGASLMAAVFATALGSRQIVDAGADTVAHAFSVTFLVAAAIVAGTLIGVVLAPRRRDRRTAQECFTKRNRAR